MTTKTNGINWLRKNGACADGLVFAKSCNSLSEAWEKCDRGDWLIWAYRRSKEYDKTLAVKCAAECALHVLPVFESRHPADNRPRKAVEAALCYINNPSNAADATTAAAAAAYAAAYAADAAAAAAYAAAYAADAAAAAAYAAAYAAADAIAAAAYAADASAERKWQAEKIREIVKNPFLCA